MKGKPYTVFKRKGSPFYYCQFKLANGRWGTAKSTRIKSKGDAEAWAIERLRSGDVIVRQGSTLADFAADFFNYEGPWAVDRRTRGLRLGRHHCQDCQRLLTKHVFPAIGNKELNAINKITIRDLRNNLSAQGYSGSSINKVMLVIKIVLDTAYDEDLLESVPKIDRVNQKPNKEKHPLTVDEVIKLFSFEWQNVPDKHHPPRDEFKGYAANLLSCLTGMRMSEIQGLAPADVNLRGGFIRVWRSYDRIYGRNTTTKSGKERIVVFPAALYQVLDQLIQMNDNPENPDSFLFFGDFKIDKPIEHKMISRTLYTALARIGIDEAERKRRNLSFHSHRHFFNSYLKNRNISQDKVKKQMGHDTDAMSEYYYHANSDDLAEIRTLQDELLQEIRGGNATEEIN